MDIERIEGNELIREIITPEGRTLKERIFTNPYTGEVKRIVTISETRYTPDGIPEIHEAQIPAIGADGSPITDIRDMAVCQECGETHSRTSTVIDPFCGRVLDLTCSQMVEVNMKVFRVCARCAKQIKWEKTKQKIKAFMFGGA